MNKIDNIKEVSALIDQTYIYAIIIVLVALIIAFIIAKSINFQGGKNERSFIKRRGWYIAIGLISPISFFLYNALLVSEKITKAPLEAKFSSANVFTTIGILGCYLIVGIITMLIFRKSKWGSILGKTK